jgi:hypothetical protein
MLRADHLTMAAAGRLEPQGYSPAGRPVSLSRPHRTTDPLGQPVRSPPARRRPRSLPLLALVARLFRYAARAVQRRP